MTGVQTCALPIFPASAKAFLKKASDDTQPPAGRFKCRIFGNEWDAFVEKWASISFDFVGNALGPYGMQPLPEILPLHDGQHAAGATASFDPSSGQVRLSSSVHGKPGQTLEKITHELTHASLALFPEGDPFYEEGVVDFMTWTLAHAPVWGEHRNSMIEAAAFNIKMRRERALHGGSDWDKKRWAGGLFASLAYGPLIVSRLRQKKTERDFTW